MAPSWIEITLTVPAELAESVASAIFEETGSGSSLEDSDRQGGRFCLLKTYLPYGPGFRKRLIGLRKAVQNLTSFFPEASIPPWGLRLVTGENWQENWKRHFRPLRVCSNLIICPTWETVEPTAMERVIRIDPGLAFGTGGHASTRLCLKALEAASLHPHLLAQVLDVGTGTGILALAAAALGGRAVLAIDTDPLAVESARDHVRLNELEGVVHVEQRSPEAVSGLFSLILANLTSQDLQRLGPVLKKLLAPQGGLIVSGFLATQARATVGGLVRAKLLFQGLYLEEEWACAFFGPEPLIFQGRGAPSLED